MDLSKLIQKLKNSSDNAKIRYLLLICLTFIFIYIVFTFFTNKPMIPTFSSNQNNTQQSNADKQLRTQYEDEQKSELRQILKQIEGVGNVDVMITFESDETKVPAVDTSSQKNTNENSDKEGSKQSNSQETDSSKVVVTSNNNGSEPLIVKTYKPKVVGVIVVAEGSESSKVKYDISKAVSNLYDLPMDKVNVYPMKK
ncbi:stage III sporulation protein AG [Clostridium manihotivorum]|uniref:Stage III sporulation protein AG n=1 Tax=Clostridium manihotivorum TaxID=2320868 RepID=A0A3R5TFG3_9CLOT|nr:stage III sporulation protein AG [Clostridium manihotivorum]QAA32064.1 stage III sporulation protein AG [Clostridium manihotivorum]